MAHWGGRARCFLANVRNIKGHNRLRSYLAGRRWLEPIRKLAQCGYVAEQSCWKWRNRLISIQLRHIWRVVAKLLVRISARLINPAHRANQPVGAALNWGQNVTGATRSIEFVGRVLRSIVQTIRCE